MFLNSFIDIENAVSSTIGYILNLMILLIITGAITGGFYMYMDTSSQRSIDVAYADMGSEIARDITNMYLRSEYSNNITLTIKREIPLTIGGKNYNIKVINASNESDGIASVKIKEGSFFGLEILGYESITKINAIDSNSKLTVCRGVTDNGVYSSSGEINIRMIINQGERDLCIT